DPRRAGVGPGRGDDRPAAGRAGGPAGPAAAAVAGGRPGDGGPGADHQPVPAAGPGRLAGRRVPRGAARRPRPGRRPGRPPPLGLVFRYGPPAKATFTAHPFVRNFFARLLGVGDPRQVFEAVRARLAGELDGGRREDFAYTVVGVPAARPTGPDLLDRYEYLI